MPARDRKSASFANHDNRDRTKQAHEVGQNLPCRFKLQLKNLITIESGPQKFEISKQQGRPRRRSLPNIRSAPIDDGRTWQEVIRWLGRRQGGMRSVGPKTGASPRMPPACGGVAKTETRAMKPGGPSRDPLPSSPWTSSPACAHTGGPHPGAVHGTAASPSAAGSSVSPGDSRRRPGPARAAPRGSRRPLPHRTPQARDTGSRLQRRGPRAHRAGPCP